MYYRKLFEPDYGPVAPEVKIGEPQILDLARPGVWRAKCNVETIRSINEALYGCVCYEPMMEVEVQDRIVGNGGVSVPIRVYFPVEDSPHPVLVLYHGGGFSMNNIEVYDGVARYLARFGNLVVVSVDYHLAPEYKFPRGLDECYAATAWAEKETEALGGARGKLCVCGDSSGGNFAAAVSLMARDRKGPAIDKQILIYPLTIQHLEQRPDSELHYGKGYFLEYNSTQDQLSYYFENTGDAFSPYASPLAADDLSGLPAACFLSAECDPILDQGLMYAAKLTDAAVPVEYHLYRGMIHGFINSAYGKTFDCLNQVCRFANNWQIQQSGKKEEDA